MTVNQPTWRGSPIITADQLPADQKVYLKKDMFGWRVVEPLKREDGSMNWPRILFGTKRERAFMAFIIILAILGYLAYDEQVSNYHQVLSKPCDYCTDCRLASNRNFSSSLNSCSVTNFDDLAANIDLNG